MCIGRGVSEWAKKDKENMQCKKEYDDDDDDDV